MLLWRGTSKTPEQEHAKKEELLLVYKKVRERKWPLAIVARAFDDLICGYAANKGWWPKWATIQEQVAKIADDLAPPKTTAPPATHVRHRMADEAMVTELGQMALREGWGRSYHVGIERRGLHPDLSTSQIATFRKAKSDFDWQFAELERSGENANALHIGRVMIRGEEQLRERFLR